MTREIPYTKPTDDYPAPNPDAPMVWDLGEFDGVPEDVAVPVKLTGQVTPPYDTLGAVLDRARRVGLQVHEVKTDGSVRSVSEAARAIAAELGYTHNGHPYAGRHEPHAEIKRIDRNIRLEWHLRALTLAGLDPADAAAIHRALDLPDRGHEFWRSCDELDRHNEEASRANLTGETNGAKWEIRGPLGFHWPVFRLHVTIPGGGTVSGRMDLRDYVATHIVRLLTDAAPDRTEGATDA